MKKIFVSYGRPDLHQVQQIVQELGNIGLDFWMDTRNLQTGDLWTREISKGIDDCGAFLLFMSANSMASDNVRREVQLAFEKKRKIFLLRLDTVQIPEEFQFMLAGIQWVDYSSYDWKTRLVWALAGNSSYPSAVTQTEILHQNTPLSNRSTKNKPSPAALAYPENILPGREKELPSEQSQSTAYTIETISHIIERMCYNGDLSLAQGAFLKEILETVAMMKKKYGEKTMSVITNEFSDNAFLQSSRTLAYYLLTLADCHSRWPNLNLSGNLKNESLTLLTRVQDEILTSSALIQQTHAPDKKQNISFETKRLISSLRALRLQFTNIDRHLYTGHLPYEISNELERNFDDLVYLLNKYILILDALANTKAGPEFIQ